MIEFCRHRLWVLVVIVSTTLRCASGQANVTTQHNDIARTGQNLSEKLLTPANVNSTQFGKLFNQPVDGQVYAQPLYMSAVTIGGVKHNVVYVATANDTIYAFDADSNGGINALPLWKASMLDPVHGAAAGATAVPTAAGADLTPIYGITGTPVIDPATNTLYVVSASYEGGQYPIRLHALDIASGAEKFGGPVAITATAAGTGNGSVNGTLTFDSEWQNQRGGLLLLNGIVYIGFGSHMDNGPWHGWILGYNAATLKQTGALCTSPNGIGAGVWMGGTGLAADVPDPVNHPFGRMFVATGNGDYNATRPYNKTMEFGDSHLALDLTNGIPTITDEFTTKNQAILNAQDEDLASGGIVLLPKQTTGSVPNLAVQTGKEGTLYLLNRDNLGGYNTTTNQIVQELDGAIGTPGIWGAPAYWNGHVYYWGNGDYLKSFSLVNGLLSTPPATNGVYTNFPGSTPSISANGNTNALLWTVDTSGYNTGGPAILRAFDATNINIQPYSTQGIPARDTPGPAVKFAVPTIANGKVYVGTANQLDVYGLLNGATQAATPVFTPASKSFNGELSVTITDATPNATIFYTTDGSTPTAASTPYTQPILLTSTQTIKAIGSATGYLASVVASATYTDLDQTVAVAFSLPSGTYTSAQKLTLTTATPNATIYYTTNGMTPTTSSTVYTGPISITASRTITAFATAASLTPSAIVAQSYTIASPSTSFSFPSGFANSQGIVILNGSSRLNDSRLQLTDGLNNEAGSAWYFQPMNVQKFAVDFTFQLSNPVADGITFAIQNSPKGSAALGAIGSSLGYGSIPNSVAIKFDLHSNAGEGNDSTGLYLNGAIPTVPAIDLTDTPIDLHSDDMMAVHLLYDGTTLTLTILDEVTGGFWSTSWTVDIPATIGSKIAYLGFTGGTGGASASQKITSWSYVNVAVKPPVAVPAISLASGTYYGPQTVSITDATPGATIFYTTDGSVPTASSRVYVSPLSVTATETLRVFVTAPARSSSSIISTYFTIKPVTPTAAPVFSVASGAHSAPFTLTLTSATAQAAIYFTTDGTAPTTSSRKYTGPIAVSGTDTVQAIALAANHSISKVSSASYTFLTQPPVFSPIAGTYTSAQSVRLTSATAGSRIYYTVDGSIPTNASTLYKGSIAVGSSQTIKGVAIAAGYSASKVVAATYTILLPAARPVLSLASGTYSGPQTVTLTDATAGAKMYYTLDGTVPTTSSKPFSGSISVTASATLRAMAISSTTSSSGVTSGYYTIKQVSPAKAR